MDKIPDIRLPFNRRIGETLWRTLRYPPLDRWLDDADWVYCPKELYVPVREVRYAVTVHDLYRLEPAFREGHGRSDFRWRWLLKRALSDADLVLSVSEFTKQRLVALVGVDPSKIRVVGNGVEDQYFTEPEQPTSRIPETVEPPYVLSIGGVTRKKGGEYLLAAAARLADVDPELKVVIAGPVEPVYKSRVASAPNIRLLQRGFPDSDMHRLIKGAEAALVLSEYEGFGIPVLEAMAARVPVVAARRAALPEVVGDAGLLVDPTDSGRVAELVTTLVYDRETKAALVAKGRTHAEQYRWASCVQRLSQAFEEF